HRVGGDAAADRHRDRGERRVDVPADEQAAGERTEPAADDAGDHVAEVGRRAAGDAPDAATDALDDDLLLRCHDSSPFVCVDLSCALAGRAVVMWGAARQTSAASVPTSAGSAFAVGARAPSVSPSRFSSCSTAASSVGFMPALASATWAPTRPPTLASAAST